jgi:hypothetical protein
MIPMDGADNAILWLYVNVYWRFLLRIGLCRRAGAVGEYISEIHYRAENQQLR